VTFIFLDLSLAYHFEELLLNRFVYCTSPKEMHTTYILSLGGCDWKEEVYLKLNLVLTYRVELTYSQANPGKIKGKYSSPKP
jgi:hypothetical protein